MLPDSFYILRVRTPKFGKHLGGDELITDKGDLVDQALDWKDAVEIDAFHIVHGVARQMKGYVTAQAISSVLNDHDFHSDSPPVFPTWCEKQGNSAWRRALAEMQADEAHVRQERANLTTGAFA